MNDFEDIEREALQPIFLEAGATLFDCQSFEYNIAYLLYLFSRLRLISLENQKITAILEDDEKKTAGQLIHLLKQQLPVSEGLEKSLSKSLKARNKFVHRYLIDNVERFIDPLDRDQIVIEIKSLRSTIRKTHKLLEPFIKALAETVEGKSIEKFQEEAREQFIKNLK
jgi:uncharacterized protein YutE (UPF0331/DUF86 family)